MKTLLHVIFVFLQLLAIKPAILSAYQNDEQIVVRLSTDQLMLPLYIAPIHAKGTQLSRDYISELEKIFIYDFKHNGFTYVVPASNEKNSIAKYSEFDTFPANLPHWESENIFHIIKLEITNSELSANLFLLNTNAMKSIKNVTLTGNINSDRLQIHRLADAFHKAIFGKDGIATTRILYTCKSKVNNTWLSEVWESDYDGSNPIKISGEGFGYCITPTYIPPSPGNQPGAFMYVSYKNGQPKIFLASLMGENIQRLTSLRGNQLMPTISKNRDKVAFICDVSGNPDLFLQLFSPERGAIGKPRQIYFARGATQGTPTFSPDGNSIAFVSNKDGNARIYVMEIPTESAVLKDVKVRLVSRANRESSAPAWSPDGTKLAYCARSGGERQIWIYDFEEDKEWQLTKGWQNKENPSWAPNSLHLIYNTTDSNAAELYTIDLKQKTPTKISTPSGEKRFPAWQPKR